MDEILYFKENLPGWVKQLIPGVKSKDAVVVLKTRKEDSMLLIFHEESEYEGWMDPDLFADTIEEIVSVKMKKIDWDDVEVVENEDLDVPDDLIEEEE